MTMAQIPVNDPRCAFGGAALTVQGVTVNICSGVAPPAPAPASTIMTAADFQQVSHRLRAWQAEPITKGMTPAITGALAERLRKPVATRPGE